MEYRTKRRQAALLSNVEISLPIRNKPNFFLSRHPYTNGSSHAECLLQPGVHK
jgi:hypothetical protein